MRPVDANDRRSAPPDAVGGVARPRSVGGRTAGDRRRRDRGSRSGRPSPSRTSAKPAARAPDCSTTTCWSRSPRHAFDRAFVARPRPRGSRRPRPAAPPCRWPAPAPSRAASPYSARAASSSSSDLEPRLEAGQLRARGARTDARAPLVLDAGARQLGLARRRARSASPRCASCARRRRFGGGRAVRARRARSRCARRRLRRRASTAFRATRSRADARVLERMAQRRRGIDGREHLAARRFDVRLEAFDLAVRRVVGLRIGRQRRPPRDPARVSASAAAPRRASAARAPARARCSSVSSSGRDGAPRAVERLHLLAIERDLLLLAVDGRARAHAPLRARAVARDSASTSSMRSAAQIGFDLGDARRGDRLALARLREAARAPIRSSRPAGDTCARTGPSPSAAARRAASDTAAPSPACRFSVPRCFSTSNTMSSMRVRFCCAASSFSSAGAAARLVLRDAGRLFDQLPAIGRPRAENQPDLALLDDRVGLGAEARVHQQVVNVAQPADLTVDQVFALARPVQAPRDFDLARDRLNQSRRSLPSARHAVAAPTRRP